MPDVQLGRVLHDVGKLVAAESLGGLPDRELLTRFVTQRDEAAFAALVRRHGPLVFGVCRRVLRDAHDAEDACQATFLVLAHKAGSIRWGDALASWLHGVAFRTAARLRRDVERRRGREAPAVDPPTPDAAEASWRDVRAVLDEEIGRLPEHLRSPVLLCYLDGLTRDEAAQRLGWGLDVLRGRLERGRLLLRRRLTRRGLTLPAALLSALLAERAALSATLLVQIARPALQVAAGHALPAGAVSAQVISLTEGVLKAMSLSKLRLLMIAVLALGLFAAGTGVWSLTAQQAEGPDPAAPPPVVAAAPPAAQRQPPDDPQRLREQAQSRLNLKALARALHAYYDTYQRFPPPAHYSAGAGRSGPGFPGAPAGNLPGGEGMAPGGSPPGGAGIMGLPPRADAPPGMAPPGGPMPGGMPMMGGPAVVGRGGKALLSWRVAILPQLGEGELYKQFKFDEPWDSPHNKRLLKKMPRVFAAPGDRNPEPTTTYYQAFVGPNAAFEKHRAVRLADIHDGTANTLLLAEAARPVPWTKPEDIDFDPQGPLPKLGGLFPGLFHAALADGSVHPFTTHGAPEQLLRAILRNDGQPVELQRLRLPASRREAELRRENERIKEGIERERARMAALQREFQLLNELAETAEARQLREENEQLETRLRLLRVETEQLRAEVERLRQRQSGPRDRK